VVVRACCHRLVLWQTHQLIAVPDRCQWPCAWPWNKPLDSADGSRVLAQAQTGCGDDCLNRHSYVHCDEKLCPCGAVCSNRPFHRLRRVRIGLGQGFKVKIRVRVRVRVLNPVSAV